ncbi:protein CREG1-like [Asterias amurensis]|uniref:protein CREG1-like n=1 Tax=Asterias amurensis TaxID=7602 RepID=UPI003AB89A04
MQQAKYANLLLTAVVVLGFCSSSVQCFSKKDKYPPPPPTEQTAQMARYVVHRADWCTLTTISSNSDLVGLAFSEPTSVSDGPVANSTGVPVMYHAMQSYVMQDIVKNSKVTLSFSEAVFGAEQCQPGQESDPEFPLCARVTIMGNAAILTDPKEIAAAEKALFSRHPAMASWSKAHEFKFLKLNITNVLIIDFFGGWVTVPVDEYMKAKP